jgi:hypothetical protein
VTATGHCEEPRRGFCARRHVSQAHHLAPPAAISENAAAASSAMDECCRVVTSADQCRLTQELDAERVAPPAAEPPPPPCRACRRAVVIGFREAASPARRSGRSAMSCARLFTLVHRCQMLARQQGKQLAVDNEIAMTIEVDLGIKGLTSKVSSNRSLAGLRPGERPCSIRAMARSV